MTRLGATDPLGWVASKEHVEISPRIRTLVLYTNWFLEISMQLLQSDGQLCGNAIPNDSGCYGEIQKHSSRLGLASTWLPTVAKNIVTVKTHHKCKVLFAEVLDVALFVETSLSNMLSPDGYLGTRLHLGLLF